MKRYHNRFLTEQDIQPIVSLHRRVRNASFFFIFFFFLKRYHNRFLTEQDTQPIVSLHRRARNASFFWVRQAYRNMRMFKTESRGSILSAHVALIQGVWLTLPSQGSFHLRWDATDNLGDCEHGHAVQLRTSLPWFFFHWSCFLQDIKSKGLA